MCPWAPRAMQMRHVASVLFVVAVVTVLFSLHLLTEVSRLDDARIKLGKSLSSRYQFLTGMRKDPGRLFIFVHVES